MVSSVFGFDTEVVECTLCGHSHLDKDWFSVHPHRRHLCAGCGRHFRDVGISVGNPLTGLRGVGGKRPKVARATKRCRIRQADYPGGIMIWGSNPAIVWTGQRSELEGIHVHAFAEPGSERPDVDETFAEVVVDGQLLQPAIVRTLMAQSALPHLAGRVLSMRCRGCAGEAFDAGAAAFSPAVVHTCTTCGGEVVGAGRFRRVVANPLIDVLKCLSSTAPRPPQTHDLGLIPETL